MSAAGGHTRASAVLQRGCLRGVDNSEGKGWAIWNNKFSVFKFCL